MAAHPPVSDEEFNSHVKKLVEAFETLIEELIDLRKRAPSVSYTETEVVAKGREAVRYIYRSTGWTSSRTRDCRDSPKPSPLGTEQLETDFTTRGKESSLSCPFSFMSSRYKLADPPHEAPAGPQRSRDSLPPPAKPKRHSRKISDPITAELHCGSLACAAPSILASAPKCPIRYLDQHSPEELAQYFESHKHELPRSHEVCVRRFQSNQESIRQLDAKYGDLVSMIQGLGIRHRPLLPVKDDDEDSSVEAEQVREDEMLEQWAEGVSETYRESDEGSVVKDEDKGDRGRSHEVNSDRLLKEIRVGESPSRPWGIPIPPLPEPILITNPSERADPTHATTTNTDPTPATPLPSQGADAKRKACPIRHPQQPPTTNPDPPQLPTHNSPEPATASPHPHIQFKHNAAFVTPSATAVGPGGRLQMVFTGPVFVGFSVDDARAVLGLGKREEHLQG
ncbi:MAG: hypothetical protein M1840_008192 [Geoglossum simile]|nr:MAG: hypothetical protein M1840_008192 [Geoglossum simile]